MLFCTTVRAKKKLLRLEKMDKLSKLRLKGEKITTLPSPIATLTAIDVTTTTSTAPVVGYVASSAKATTSTTTVFLFTIIVRGNKVAREGPWSALRQRPLIVQDVPAVAVLRA